MDNTHQSLKNIDDREEELLLFEDILKCVAMCVDGMNKNFMLVIHIWQESDG